MGAQPTIEKTKLYKQIHTLRKKGWTQQEIAAHLGIHKGKVSYYLNPTRHRANNAESVARYVARGYKALCDV